MRPSGSGISTLLNLSLASCAQQLDATLGSG